MASTSLQEKETYTFKFMNEHGSYTLAQKVTTEVLVEIANAELSTSHCMSSHQNQVTKISQLFSIKVDLTCDCKKDALGCESNPDTLSFPHLNNRKSNSAMNPIRQKIDTYAYAYAKWRVYTCFNTLYIYILTNNAFHN